MLKSWFQIWPSTSISHGRPSSSTHLIFSSTVGALQEAATVYPSWAPKVTTSFLVVFVLFVFLCFLFYVSRFVLRVICFHPWISLHLNLLYYYIFLNYFKVTELSNFCFPVKSDSAIHIHGNENIRKITIINEQTKSIDTETETMSRKEIA